MVVDGLLTELTISDRLVPAFIIVLICTLICEVFTIVHVEDIPVIEQVVVPGLIVIVNGKVNKMYDVEISLFIVLNHMLYLLNALILGFSTLALNYTIDEGVLTISTVLLSIR